MIIKSILAENFRKYKLLEINDLPEQGVITISGNNESGKTTIADSLSFALYGQTYSTNKENAKKLIHWGEKKASVTLYFKHKSTDYSLTRTITNKNRVIAKLSDSKTKEILTDNTEATDRMLQKILGYNFDTFANSFYLVQKELFTPHPNSNSIKEMIGISEYASIQHELYLKNRDDDAILAKIRPQYDKTVKELNHLKTDDTWLPDLIDARETFETKQTAHQYLIKQLKTSANEYPENQTNFEISQSRHSLAKLTTDILLALLVGSLVTWGLFEFFPVMTESYLYPSSTDLFLQQQQWLTTWGLPISLILAILVFIGLIISWSIEDRSIIPLKQKALNFGEHLLSSFQEAEANIPELLPSRINKLIGINPELTNSSTISAQNRDNMEILFKEISHYKVSAKASFEASHQLQLGLQKKTHEVENYQSALNNEINDEMQRTAVASGVRKKLNNFDITIQKHSRNLKVRKKAVSLLQASAKQLTEAFNQTITHASAQILPHFTFKRYSTLTIDEAMQVKVFSEEKNNFMDYDEISSGTQRQIMLAIRIAMSEELARNTQTKKQFIIMDEPFAFFDSQRTIETLKHIGTVSDIISQFWLFTQEFPHKTASDIHIQCHTDEDKLVIKA